MDKILLIIIGVLLVLLLLVLLNVFFARKKFDDKIMDIEIKLKGLILNDEEISRKNDKKMIAFYELNEKFENLKSEVKEILNEISLNIEKLNIENLNTEINALKNEQVILRNMMENNSSNLNEMYSSKKYDLEELVNELNDKISNINVMINSNHLRINICEKELNSLKEFNKKNLNSSEHNCVSLLNDSDYYQICSNVILKVKEEFNAVNECVKNMEKILQFHDYKISNIQKIVSELPQLFSELQSIKRSINIDHNQTNLNVVEKPSDLDLTNLNQDNTGDCDEYFKEIENFFKPIEPNSLILKGEKVVKPSHYIVGNDIISYADLNEEKQKLFKMMETTNKNFFITGKAGTGKSYLLKFFRNNTKKKAIYLAPTGIAAININGVTIHSAFGFNNINGSAYELKISSSQEEIFKNVNTIVIDEISMVRVDVLERIDYILKKINKNNIPFGGKQMIIIGDIFQLPPVAKKEEMDYLNNTYNGIYFFNSNAYKEADFHGVELKEVFRQRDIDFLNLLNDVRNGNITQELIDKLNTRYNKNICDDVIQIVSKKNIATAINKYKLSQNKGEEFVYYAKYDRENKLIDENDYPFVFELHLKVGAIVLMVDNDPQKRWVNGTFAKVSYLSEKIIKVIINGIEYEVNPIICSKKTCYYNREINQVEYARKDMVVQYPLVLGYAITIHKSQGSTFAKMACDLNECFVHGQAYVALSRCTNFENLYLLNEIKDNPFLINYEIIEFYNKTFNKI